MQVRNITKAAKVTVPILLIGLAGCTTINTYDRMYGNGSQHKPKSESIMASAQNEKKITYTKVTENLEKPQSYFVNFMSRSNKFNPWEVQDVLHATIKDSYISSPTIAYHAVYSVDGSFCEVDFLAFKDKKDAREYMKKDMSLLYSESNVKKYKRYKRCFKIRDTRHDALEWVSDANLLKIMWQKDVFGDPGPDVLNLIDDFLEKYPPDAK